MNEENPRWITAAWGFFQRPRPDARRFHAATAASLSTLVPLPASSSLEDEPEALAALAESDGARIREGCL